MKKCLVSEEGNSSWEEKVLRRDYFGKGHDQRFTSTLFSFSRFRLYSMRHQHRCFPVNIETFLRTAFFLHMFHSCDLYWLVDVCLLWEIISNFRSLLNWKYDLCRLIFILVDRVLSGDYLLIFYRNYKLLLLQTLLKLNYCFCRKNILSKNFELRAYLFVYHSQMVHSHR